MIDEFLSFNSIIDRLKYALDHQEFLPVFIEGENFDDLRVGLGVYLAFVTIWFKEPDCFRYIKGTGDTIKMNKTVIVYFSFTDFKEELYQKRDFGSIKEFLNCILNGRIKTGIIQLLKESV